MSVISIPARNETNPFASMKGDHVAVRVPDLGNVIELAQVA